MSDRTEDANGSLARLAAMVVELRAELLVTQAALAATMAGLAKQEPEPQAALGDAVARLLGFADAAAAGLAVQPGARPVSATAAAMRMADWAEGLLPPGRHPVQEV